MSNSQGLDEHQIQTALSDRESLRIDLQSFLSTTVPVAAYLSGRLFNELRFLSFSLHRGISEQGENGVRRLTDVVSQLKIFIDVVCEHDNGSNCIKTELEKIKESWLCGIESEARIDRITSDQRMLRTGADVDAFEIVLGPAAQYSSAIVDLAGQLNSRLPSGKQLLFELGQLADQIIHPQFYREASRLISSGRTTAENFNGWTTETSPGRSESCNEIQWYQTVLARRSWITSTLFKLILECLARIERAGISVPELGDVQTTINDGFGQLLDSLMKFASEVAGKSNPFALALDGNVFRVSRKGYDSSPRLKPREFRLLKKLVEGVAVPVENISKEWGDISPGSTVKPKRSTLDGAKSQLGKGVESLGLEVELNDGEWKLVELQS